MAAKPEKVNRIFIWFAFRDRRAKIISAVTRYCVYVKTAWPSDRPILVRSAYQCQRFSLFNDSSEKQRLFSGARDIKLRVDQTCPAMYASVLRWRRAFSRRFSDEMLNTVPQRLPIVRDVGFIAS
jgi:hypothetical protein